MIAESKELETVSKVIIKEKEIIENCLPGFKIDFKSIAINIV